jgi:hypothetical protein
MRAPGRRVPRSTSESRAPSPPTPAESRCAPFPSSVSGLASVRGHPDHAPGSPPETPAFTGPPRIWAR